METLTMVCHDHRFQAKLRIGDRLPLGESWQPGSKCDSFLFSLPYPFGPKLEWMDESAGRVRFVWALPITSQEAAFAKKHGVEELEKRFDAVGLRYWDTNRESTV